MLGDVVRRDANEGLSSQEAAPSFARRAFPSGENPVPVGAEAPGSRSQAAGEIPLSKRDVESLYGGSNNAGRNMK